MSSGSEDLPEGVIEQFWLIRRVQTGHGYGMRSQDDRFSDAVMMILWAHDLDEPGQFAMSPDQADQLADSLKDSARLARLDSPGSVG